MKISTYRTSGAVLILIGFVWSWAMTYILAGAPVLPWDSFPFIPIEHIQKIKPLGVAAVIINWLVSTLLILNGFSVLIRAKSSWIVFDVLRPLFGVAAFAIVAVAFATEMELGKNTTVLFMLIGGAIGCPFVAKMM